MTWIKEESILATSGGLETRQTAIYKGSTETKAERPKCELRQSRQKKKQSRDGQAKNKEQSSAEKSSKIKEAARQA